MIKTFKLLMVTVLLAGMAQYSFAQGCGRGPCGMAGNCPFGLNAAAGQGGGWWMRVTPTDPKQKEFIQEVTRLHNAIRTSQIELAQLQAQNADAAAITAKQTEIDATRSELHTLMVNNRATMQQLVGKAGFGRGYGRGMGAANCPLRTECANGFICPACPYAK